MASPIGSSTRLPKSRSAGSKKAMMVVCLRTRARRGPELLPLELAAERRLGTALALTAEAGLAAALASEASRCAAAESGSGIGVAIRSQALGGLGDRSSHGERARAASDQGGVAVVHLLPDGGRISLVEIQLEARRPCERGVNQLQVG